MKKCLLVLVTVAFVVGCTDRSTGSLAELVGVPREGGIVQPGVVVEATGGVTVVRIRIDAQAFELGAYQGRFTFDPTVMEFLEASVPEDGYRVLNTLRADEGEIRFAGFTVEQFVSPVAVELRFRTERPVVGEDVFVNLEVVGDLLGEEVPQDRVLPQSFRRIEQ